MQEIKKSFKSQKAAEFLYSAVTFLLYSADMRAIRELPLPS